MWRILIIVAALVLVGCAVTPTEPRPLATYEKDDQPAFQVDPAQPFRIEVGRGSALTGMDTIALTQDSQVVMHRRRTQQTGEQVAQVWERATFRLSADAVMSVLAALQKREIMGLHKAYHSGAADGTQWVVWVQQGEQEKSVYCDNQIPDQVRNFVADLDAILAANTPTNLQWESLAPDADPRHAEALWKSVK